MLAGIVIHDGLLDPERTVASYLPELSDSALAQSRVQDALDMTAAVRYGEDYDNAGDDFWHEAAVVGWRNPWIFVTYGLIALGSICCGG